MPGVASRGGGRRRRTMNEINMVPFIDVMLVLLIIFMVSAPLITTGSVDLPSVGKSSQRPDKVIEVLIAKNGKMRLKVNGDTQERDIVVGDLKDRVLAAQGEQADVPVVISADKGVIYDRVVEAMRTLQNAGVQRVGLSVKQGG